MAKHYRIHINGKQREEIDADLMARIVLMLGRQLAEDARAAIEAAREAEAAQRAETSEDQPAGPNAADDRAGEAS
jgi:hypothetical protein